MSLHKASPVSMLSGEEKRSSATTNSPIVGSSWWRGSEWQVAALLFWKIGKTMSCLELLYGTGVAVSFMEAKYLNNFYDLKWYLQHRVAEVEKRRLSTGKSLSSEMQFPSQFVKSWNQRWWCNMLLANWRRPCVTATWTFETTSWPIWSWPEFSGCRKSRKM